MPRRAEPHVERINVSTGETVHLAVLQGDNVVTLLKREARHAVRVDTGPVGQSDAAHATATGKAMLAWLPEDEIRRILALKGMTRFTANTITDLTALIEELRLVRRNGMYASAFSMVNLRAWAKKTFQFVFQLKTPLKNASIFLLLLKTTQTQPCLVKSGLALIGMSVTCCICFQASEREF